MKVITRQAAALAGKTRFYTGKACRNGHDVERYVANGSCVECMSCHNSAHRARLGIMIAKGREAAGVS